MTSPTAGKAVVRSCASCPSFLRESEVPSKLGKSIGAAMCGRFGRVLSRPDLSEEHRKKLQMYIGSKCESYGEPAALTGMQASGALQVALPLPSIEKAPSNLDGLCKSCTQCKFFTPDYKVAEELGWLAGYCQAKGKLILSTRHVQEARACEFKYYGTISNLPSNVPLFPEYQDNFWMAGSFKDWLEKLDEVVDPQHYVTDKPISPEDKSLGIRAWRLVTDPEGFGGEVYLPIFDLEHFAPEERTKVPMSGDDEHPDTYIDHNGAVYKLAVAWMALDETPMLWGEPGTGKTELLRHMAWLMSLPFERISITASTELDDLAGKMLFVGNETVFQYGRIPKAWSKKSVICLDEPNTGPPDVWQFIRPLTDNSKQLVLDQNKGERIARDDFCFLGMAANPAWDPRNVGAATLGDADGNRLMHIFMTLPPESIEKEILRKRVSFDGWSIPEDKLTSIMKAAKDLRGLCADGTLPISWGVRPQIKVARAMRWFDPLTAYRVAVADYLEPSGQDTLMGVIKAHFK